MQPIIIEEIKIALEKSSNKNITIATKRGIVSNGCPIKEINFAKEVFI
jgi:hypothetical protein